MKLNWLKIEVMRHGEVEGVGGGEQAVCSSVKYISNLQFSFQNLISFQFMSTEEVREKLDFRNVSLL